MGRSAGRFSRAMVKIAPPPRAFQGGAGRAGYPAPGSLPERMRAPEDSGGPEGESGRIADADIVHGILGRGGVRRRVDLEFLDPAGAGDFLVAGLEGDA